MSDSLPVVVRNPIPAAPVTLDGREIVEKDARALFDAFRQVEAELQKYIAKFPDGSRERYLLQSRYHSQLKRWLNSDHRYPHKSPSHSAWRNL